MARTRDMDWAKAKMAAAQKQLDKYTKAVRTFEHVERQRSQERLERKGRVLMASTQARWKADPEAKAAAKDWLSTHLKEDERDLFVEEFGPFADVPAAIDRPDRTDSADGGNNGSEEVGEAGTHQDGATTDGVADGPPKSRRATGNPSVTDQFKAETVGESEEVGSDNGAESADERDRAADTGSDAALDSIRVKTDDDNDEAVAKTTSSGDGFIVDQVESSDADRAAHQNIDASRQLAASPVNEGGVTLVVPNSVEEFPYVIQTPEQSPSPEDGSGPKKTRR